MKYTESPDLEYINDLFLKNKDQQDTMWDLPHTEVMENLAKFKTYFSTYWDEACNITALEALSHGVPLICNASVCGFQFK